MIKNTVLPVAGLVFAAMALGWMITACGNKATQQFNDAPRTADQNSAPATVGNMPDGFGNWARKCDGPNMVYVIFHNDNAYGAISVVPNDPRCTGAH